MKGLEEWMPHYEEDYLVVVVVRVVCEEPAQKLFNV